MHVATFFFYDFALPHYIKEERRRVEGRVFISSAFRTFFLTYLPEPKVIGLAREASKGKKCFRTIQSAKTSIAIAAEKALSVDFVSWLYQQAKLKGSKDCTTITHFKSMQGPWKSLMSFMQENLLIRM